MNLSDTCVYIHTRFIDGVVFYVGIGNLGRPHDGTRRNQQWHRTTEKYAYTVTILHENLTWEQACAIEIELIAKYRELSGDKLCNVTTGGEGTKGVKTWLGKKHSDKSRARMSNSRKGNTNSLGTVHSEETRAKMREAKQNMSQEARANIGKASTGRRHSEETRARIGAAIKGVKRSPETIAKMKESRKNRPPMSPETRAKMSEAGKNRSPETRAKMSEAQKARYQRAGKYLR